MSTQRYQHLKPRVKANASPYRSSIASRSKRDDEKQKEAEKELQRLKEWKALNGNITL